MITMENLFTPLKSVLVTALCAVGAFFAPIANLIFAIFIIFLLNCIAGLIADIAISRKKFDLKKFFHCLFETMVFYVIIMAIYVIGDKLLNMTGAIQCSTVIVYLQRQYSSQLSSAIPGLENSEIPVLCLKFRGDQEDTIYGKIQGK